MFGKVKELLIRSYTSNSTQEMQEVTKSIQGLMRLSGFVRALVEIVFDNSAHESTILASLAQLKNVLRQHWQIHFDKNKQNIQIPPEDMKFMKDNIFEINCALVHNPKKGKLIKDIIMLMRQYALPSGSRIVQALQDGQQLKGCLNFVLGIFGYMSFQHMLKGKDKNDKIVFALVEAVTNMIASGQRQLFQRYQQLQAVNLNQQLDPVRCQHFNSQYQSHSNYFDELLYLSIKLMKKAIYCTDEKHLREYSFQWAGICLEHLKNIKEDIRLSLIDQQYAQLAPNSLQFIYYHSRKWAIKYLTSFFQRCLIYKASDHQINLKCQQFYEEYWHLFLKVLQSIFNQPTTSKIRRLELNLLEMVVRVKPQKIVECFDYYMFKVIPSYLTYTNQDLKLALDNPTQFIIFEDFRPEESQNMRVFGVNLWNKLLSRFIQYDYQLNFNLCQKTFIYMEQCIQNSQIQIQLIGADLFIHWSQSLMYPMQSSFKTQLFKKFNPLITSLSNWLILEFTRYPRSMLMPTIKALEVFTVNRHLIKKEAFQAVKRIIEDSTQFGLSPNKEADIIRIKAIIALGQYSQLDIKNIQEQRLQKILTTFMEIMSKYELQKIMNSFKRFVKNASNRLIPYTVDIIKTIRKYRQNLLVEDDYNHLNHRHLWNQSGTRYQYLATLNQFMPLVGHSVQIKEELEAQLQWLVSCLLTIQSLSQNNSNIHEHSQDIYSFLRDYLQMVRQNDLRPSRQLSFYIEVILLKLITLPSFAIQIAEMSPSLSNNEKLSLKTTMQPQMYNYLSFLKIVILYLPHIAIDGPIRPVNQILNDIAGSTCLEKIILMEVKYYNLSDNYQLGISLQDCLPGRICTTITLIYLLQEHSELPINLYQIIWIVIVSNERETELKVWLKRYNVQLMCLFVWNKGEDNFSLDLEEADEPPEAIIIGFIKRQAFQLQSPVFEQSRRLTLGLSTMLRIAAKGGELLSHFECLITILVKNAMDTLQRQEYSQQDNSDELGTWQMLQKQEQAANSDEKRYKDEPNLVVQLGKLSSFREEPLDDYLMELCDSKELHREQIPTRLDSCYELYDALQALAIFQSSFTEQYRSAVDLISEDIQCIITYVPQFETHKEKLAPGMTFHFDTNN